jgi:uncharacterized PurR-regulated membrane protein YhhQ (DUF165 family)
MISSTIGSILDTFIFFSIAFSTATFLLLPDSNTWATELVPVLGIGPMLPLWVSLALADLGIKLVLATFMLLPYRLVLTRIARLSESA